MAERCGAELPREGSRPHGGPEDQQHLAQNDTVSKTTSRHKRLDQEQDGGKRNRLQEMMGTSGFVLQQMDDC